jgi:hypothetical protein
MSGTKMEQYSDNPRFNLTRFKTRPSLTLMEQRNNHRLKMSRLEKLPPEVLHEVIIIV